MYDVGIHDSDDDTYVSLFFLSCKRHSSSLITIFMAIICWFEAGNGRFLEWNGNNDESKQTQCEFFLQKHYKNTTIFKKKFGVVRTIWRRVLRRKRICSKRCFKVTSSHLVRLLKQKASPPLTNESPLRCHLPLLKTIQISKFVYKDFA